MTNISSKINILLTGVGKWGQNYIKTLANFPNVNLKLANRSNWKQLINDRPDKIIVATPPDSHIEIASYALERNIPTMIEKPLALSLSEIDILSKFDPKLILVNHIHLFSQSYQRVKALVQEQKIKSIISNGYNKGPFRNYSGLWDYGPHDVSMILDLANELPKSVIAVENKMESGSLFVIKMNFGNFSSFSIVGNGGEFSMRNLIVNFNDVSISDKDVKKSCDEQPLELALKAFLAGKYNINGLEFSKKVMMVLDACQKSVDENNNATISVS